MNLKELLTHLLKEDTPDVEERGDAQQTSKATSSQDLRDTQESEKVANDAGSVSPSGGTIDDDDVASEHDDDDEYDDALPNVDFDTQPEDGPHGLRSVLSRIWSTVFPSPSNEEEIRAYIPNYRILPIISGIIIPFCILLEIPGLTAHWYIRTEGSTIVTTKPNPPLLDAGIALSIFCAVVANLCLVIRFLEKRIKTMTILCTVFLSIHGKLTVLVLHSNSATLIRYYQHCRSRCVRGDKVGRLHIRTGILDDSMFHDRVHVHERHPHHRSYSNPRF